jgi:hypothetical protein
MQYRLIEEHREFFVTPARAAFLMGVPEKTLQHQRRMGIGCRFHPHAGNVIRYKIGDIIDYLNGIRRAG